MIYPIHDQIFSLLLKNTSKWILLTKIVLWFEADRLFIFHHGEKWHQRERQGVLAWSHQERQLTDTSPHVLEMMGEGSAASFGIARTYHVETTCKEYSWSIKEMPDPSIFCTPCTMTNGWNSPNTASGEPEIWCAYNIWTCTMTNGRNSPNTSSGESEIWCACNIWTMPDGSVSFLISFWHQYLSDLQRKGSCKSLWPIHRVPEEHLYMSIRTLEATGMGHTTTFNQVSISLTFFFFWGGRGEGNTLATVMDTHK